MKWHRSIPLVASLILLSAVIASWIVVRATNTHLASFQTAHTQQWLGVFRAKYTYALVVGNYMNSQDINLRQDCWPAVWVTRYRGQGFALAIGAPYWMVALAFLILPIWRFRDWVRRRRRRAKNLCVDCGYDLRGTPRDAKGRCTCPEDGAATLR